MKTQSENVKLHLLTALLKIFLKSQYSWWKCIKQKSIRQLHRQTWVPATTILSGTCIITLACGAPSGKPCSRSAFGGATLSFSGTLIRWLMPSVYSISYWIRLISAMSAAGREGNAPVTLQKKKWEPRMTEYASLLCTTGSEHNTQPRENQRTFPDGQYLSQTQESDPEEQVFLDRMSLHQLKLYLD